MKCFARGNRTSSHTVPWLLPLIFKQSKGTLCKVILRDSSGSSDCTSLYNDKKKLVQ